jgi:hypothetical protein
MSCVTTLMTSHNTKGVARRGTCSFTLGAQPLERQYTSTTMHGMRWRTEGNVGLCGHLHRRSTAKILLCIGRVLTCKNIVQAVQPPRRAMRVWVPPLHRTRVQSNLTSFRVISSTCPIHLRTQPLTFRPVSGSRSSLTQQPALRGDLLGTQAMQ